MTPWTTGRRGETLAAWWLRFKGYAILARGWKRGRGTGAGEIDIVARRGDTLVFVEVKARADAEGAAHALRPAQRRRIEKGAAAFLAAHPQLSACAIRFDAVLLVPRRLPRHISDAWRMEA